MTTSNPPRVNYVLPIMATLAATLLIIGLFVLLALLTSLASLGQFSQGAGLTGGICGLVAVILLAAIVYFSTAIFKGVRDLGTPLQELQGRLIRKAARGRAGSYWIVVMPGDDDEESGPPPNTALLFPSIARNPPASVPPAGLPTQPLTSAPGDFGAGLSALAGATHATSAPVGEFVAPPPMNPPGARVFRVDKAVYDRLTTGERLRVGYSRHLEHVYYIQQPDGDPTVVISNKALI